MGPFPHDAPTAEISDQNPAGTDGFEFVEFAHPDPQALGSLFERMGYVAVARHKTKNVTVWRQGDVNYIVNAEPGSFAHRFVDEHGPLDTIDAPASLDVRNQLIVSTQTVRLERQRQASDQSATEVASQPQSDAELQPR